MTASADELALSSLSSDEWGDMRFVLGRLGGAWLRDEPPQATDFDEIFGSQTDATACDRYDNLGDFTYAEFYSFITRAGISLGGVTHDSPSVATLQRLDFVDSMASGREWRTPMGGMNVFARVLYFAPRAYRRYSPDTTLSDPDRLGSILLRDGSFQQTIGRLAGTTAEVTALWEDRLRLRPPYDEVADTEAPFIIAGEQTEAIYMPDPALTRNLELPEAPGCPGREVLLPKVWQHMVRLCVESDNLFRLDLA